MEATFTCIQSVQILQFQFKGDPEVVQEEGLEVGLDI